jgi:nitroreductase
MELGEVMCTTGAARRFLAKPVDSHTVYQVLDVARFAPSGGNRQPWHVIWVRDPELKRALRDLYVLGWREYAEHVRAGLVPFAPGSDGSCTVRLSTWISPELLNIPTSSGTT